MDFDEEKRDVSTELRAALKDLNNLELATNIKGLQDLVDLKQHFNDHPTHFEKFVDSIGSLLQKLCVKPNDVDIIDVNYLVHKKMLTQIESIIGDESAIKKIVASSSAFMVRLVVILEHFNDIIGKINDYEVSTKKIEKFTTIHNCLYAILSIMSVLNHTPKLFMMSYTTLSETQSFTKMIDALGQNLIQDYAYATQEMALMLCCRIIGNSEKQNNVKENICTYFPDVLQNQFEEHKPQYIMQNIRLVLDKINASSNSIKSIKIDNVFVEIEHKKSKKSKPESRSITGSSWLDLSVIELLMELGPNNEQVWIPLNKLVSVELSKSKKQLRFVCSEITEEILNQLTDEEKSFESSKITFGVEVSTAHSPKLQSIFLSLKATIEVINSEETEDFEALTEKISIATMNDLHTPSKPEEDFKAAEIRFTSERSKAAVEPIPAKAKEKKYQSVNIDQQEEDNIDDQTKKDKVVNKGKVDKKKPVVTEIRRSTRTSPVKSENVNNVSKQPPTRKSNMKPNVFEYNDDVNSVSDEETKPIEKPKAAKVKSQPKAKAQPKTKPQPKEISTNSIDNEQEDSNAKHATKATMRSSEPKTTPLKKSNERVPKAKMRSPDTKNRDSNGSGSTDTESKTAVVTTRKIKNSEIQDIDDDLDDRVSEESEYNERYLQSHYKRVNDGSRDKTDKHELSYEYTSRFSSQFSDDDAEEEKDDDDSHLDPMDVIADEDDDNDEKEDILAPLVKEIMIMQEKRLTKKRARKYESLLASATQQVTMYCDNWKNTTLANAPLRSSNKNAIESINQRVKEFFTNFDHDIDDLNRERAELDELAETVAKEEQELSDDIKKLNTYIQTDVNKVKTELGKRKRHLMEEVSKQAVPRAKNQKNAIQDLMKQFKNKC